MRHNEFAPQDACPVNAVSWLESSRFCRLLSERDGILDAEMAVPKGDGEHARPVASFRDRIGYRLPTEVEWEVACRAGTVTPCLFGYALDLLPMYCCYIGNSQGQSWVVGRGLPNPAGLFDMLGNVSEWCLDAFAVRPQVDAGSTGVSPFTNCAVRGNDYASNARHGAVGEPPVRHGKNSLLRARISYRPDGPPAEVRTVVTGVAQGENRYYPIQRSQTVWHRALTPPARSS